MADSFERLPSPEYGPANNPGAAPGQAVMNGLLRALMPGGAGQWRRDRRSCRAELNENDALDDC
jgi:hypothetical protein